MKKIMLQSIVLLVVATGLFSFVNFGGEGFEISLNNKVMVQQYGPKMSVGTIKLTAHSANDQLTIKYHHCGKVAKNRVITFKNDQNKVVKIYRFADADKPLSPMQCNVKELLGLADKNEVILKMFYTSSELINGRQLAELQVENRSLAKK